MELIKSEARNSLLKTLETERLKIERTENETLVRNEGGLKILKNSQEVKDEVATLREQMTSIQSQHVEQKAKIELMKSKMTKQDNVIAELDQTEQKAKIESLELKMKKQDNAIVELKQTDICLEDRLSTVTRGNASYKKLCYRFLTTFCNIYFKEYAKDDKKIQRAGNEIAHGGDAVVDTGLYRGSDA